MRPDMRKAAIKDALEVMVAWRLANSRSSASWRVCRASAQIIVKQHEHMIDYTLPISKLNAVAAGIVEAIVIGTEKEPEKETEPVLT